MSRALVYRWHNTFRDGRTCSQDKQRPGRPSVVHEKVVIVKNSCNTDRRMTVKDFEKLYNIGAATAHIILTERCI